MSTVEVTPAERCERVRAALAEAGCVEPAAIVSWHDGYEMVMVDHDIEIPISVVWRAWAVGDHEHTVCWPCYSAALDDDGVQPESEIDCDHDPLTSPWPPVVR